MADDVKYQEPTKYDSVYWVDTDKVKPNPYQPRKEFDEERLKSLAESIRQYGILQPLTVTRVEIARMDGGLQTEYELIAGERRLRASMLIGLKQVPVVIRHGPESGKIKLELAIIENLQREDLNAIDRAQALNQLVKEFGLSHVEVGAKIGRSREFVSNSIRLLALPEHVQQAVVNKELSEGHARALLMIADKPEEMNTLFKEIVLKKTSVRMVEQMVRRLAQDKIRKHDKTPEMMALEKSLTETLGTRVLIENRPQGGRLLIEFFSPEDLSHIVAALATKEESEMTPVAQGEAVEASQEVASQAPEVPVVPEQNVSYPNTTPVVEAVPVATAAPAEPAPVEAVAPVAPAQSDDDLYAVRNFSV